jgi:hypothetical protein
MILSGIVGLALLFILILSGCDTSTGGDTQGTSGGGGADGGGVVPPGPWVPIPQEKVMVVDSGSPPNASDINSALTDSSTGSVNLTTTSGSPVNVPIANSETLAVPAGKGVSVGDNVTLEFADGATGTIEGEVNVQSGGVLDLSDITNGDQVNLTGTIVVESGGTFEIESIGTSNTSAIKYDGGKLVLNQDSNAYLNGTLYIGPASSGAIFRWPSGGSGTSIEFSNNANVNIITLKGGEITAADEPAVVQAAVIDSDATLTLDSAIDNFGVYISLEVNGTLNADKQIIGEVDGISKIIFGPSATLNGDYVKDTDSNFYVNSVKEDAQLGETYTWNAGANRWDRTT